MLQLLIHNARIIDGTGSHVGIDYVIVNGEVVVENGINTRATLGRVLRRGH